MHNDDFDCISIRGRVAYAAACFKNYVEKFYPEQDFEPVLKLMREIVSDGDYIDAAADRYMEIIPEYLFEFDNFEQAGFEHLTKEQFASYASLIPKGDDGLNTIMHGIYDVAMVHAYGAIVAPGKESEEFLLGIVSVMRDKGVSLPMLADYEKHGFSEYGGWGRPISSEEAKALI